MALFPLAQWKGPIPNRTPGGMGHPIGLVLHIQQGTESGTNAWFHNPAAQASSHFGNPKSGPLDQWVDTADKAWAQSAGNSNWFSVEHEGRSGDSLTPSQVENDAQLLVWLHQTYAIPIRITDSVSVGGLGWHGMGAGAWGGHPDCPGAPIKAQRGEILARAAQILNPRAPALVIPPPPKEVDMYLIDNTVGLTDVNRGEISICGPEGRRHLLGPEVAAYAALGVESKHLTDAQYRAVAVVPSATVVPSTLQVSGTLNVQ